ncbi:MFS transporter [Methanobacterium bryantii]|uniref:MFS transporter n=1 Tax=Methanobacterium bryantii TaxID=2161 RepID=A0A2A2H644_METBR|nr:MFS transporter [Methanobacterium bryantii]
MVAEKSKNGWLTLIIVTLSVFTIVIDKTFLNVAIYTLIKDLGTTIQTIQAIIAIYSLVMASLMLFGGKLQEVFGRKKTFLMGASIYGAGTIVAALSINSTMLLLGWSILEGVGAALMMPATTSIISGTYGGEKRAFALGIISSMASGAGTIGPIIGGFLTTYYSWRYAFALELVIIIAILLFSKEIDVFPPVIKWREIDVLGAVNSSVGIFLLVVGVLLLNSPSSWNTAILSIIIGIILLIIFYFTQKRRIEGNKMPLLDITLFKDHSFTLGNISRMIMNFTIGGVTFIIPVFLQGVIGTNPLVTGLTLIPMSIGIFTMSFTAGKVSTRMQPRYILSIGFLASLAGSIYLSLIFSPFTTVMDMIPGVLFLGIGMGIVFPHSANIIFAAARQDQQPDASGILNTGINLGSSLGTAVLGVILILGSFGTLGGGSMYDLPASDSYGTNNHGWFEKVNAANIPTIKETGVTEDHQKANAMKDAFNVVTLMLIIGLISSLLIPIKPTKHEEHCVTTHI